MKFLKTHKKSKITLLCLLALCLTISIIIPIIVAASNDDTQNNKIIESKTFMDSSGTSHSLKYMRNEDNYSIYSDSDGYEYKFDSNGALISKARSIEATKLIAIQNKINEKKNSAEKLTFSSSEQKESVILENVAKYARNLFGAEFDKLDGTATIKKAPSSDLYLIKFTKNYGVDGFIYGAFCSATTDLDGTVRNCSMSTTVPEDFDESLVKDLTQTDVLNHVNKDIIKDFGEISEFDCSIVTLEKEGDKYYLKAQISFTVDELSAIKELSEISAVDYDIGYHRTDDTKKIIDATYCYPLGN